ncbi:MAG TPA: GTP diphosphokinase [Candidatus Competibacteraceae bacterium]|nr:GTP diphosphokinase [Candidatus Competibacteraceae bacterium]
MVTLNTTLSPDMDFETWLAHIPVHWRGQQQGLVRRAYELASASAVPREGEDDGVRWGLAVADILVELRLDHEAAAAALLYPLVRAGRLDPARVAERCSPSVARLVEGVRTLDQIGELHQQSRHAGQQLESLRKMLLAMAQDMRVVLIKLAIRLHEMRELKGRPEEEQRRIARETLDIFAPLANRLGIGRIKWELEDLALRHLEPETYKQLARALDERRADRERYIAKVMEALRAELAKAGIQAEVSGRVKHIYSIWRKMQRKKLAFEQIFDVRAVRIMVPSVADCYAALGVVHGLWNHIRKEFDDYIANPKPNGYQSLHTAVVGPEGKILEVQIRTFDMHQSAELGVAAHWRYKEGVASPGGSFEQQIAWLRQVLEQRDDDDDTGDFLDRFKAEAFSDRVYVVTPKGQIVELAQGATPLDFAYHIHTEVGHRCRGAKVNGRIVPLNHELKNGDQVDILTGKHPSPSRDWLNPHLGYIKSSRARAKVRQWFKQQDLEKNIAAGRAALEREFQRLDIHPKQLELQPLAEKFNFSRADELFAAIGHGDLTTSQVVTKLQEQILPPSRPSEVMPIAKRSGRAEDLAGGIRIRGVGNLLTQMATCCKPVPPDPIVGFVTRGRGVTIHRQDCLNLIHLTGRHPERMIEVDWGIETRAAYQVDIVVEAYDRPGLIRDISSILANDKVNVLAMNTLTDPRDGIARMGMTLEITDLGQLSRILDKIGQLPNVLGARRRS